MAKQRKQSDATALIEEIRAKQERANTILATAMLKLKDIIEHLEARIVALEALAHPAEPAPKADAN